MNIKDERIKKIRNRNMGNGYYIFLGLVFINVFIKIILGKDIGLFIVDTVSLLLSLVYYIIASLINGTLFVVEKDEYTIERKAQIRTRLYFIGIYAYVLGAIPALLYYKENELIFTITYLVLWMIPVIYVGPKNVKAGIFKIDTKKQKNTEVRNIKIYSVILGFTPALSELIKVLVIDKRSILSINKWAIFTYLVFSIIGSFIIYVVYRAIIEKNSHGIK